MNIYAVIAVKQTTVVPLKAAIESQYPNDFFAVTNDVWLVASKSVMLDFSKALGIKYKDISGTVLGTIDGAMVIPVTIYWGYSDPTIWQWLGSKLQEKTNG